MFASIIFSCPGCSLSVRPGVAMPCIDFGLAFNSPTIGALYITTTHITSAIPFAEPHAVSLPPLVKK
jgi:hypothetical protein